MLQCVAWSVALLFEPGSDACRSGLVAFASGLDQIGICTKTVAESAALLGLIAGHDLLDLSRSERVHYRRHIVGFVRQQTARNLVPYLTASQGVDLPMNIAGVAARADHCRRRIAKTLAT